MSITGMISFAGKARIDGLINGNVEGEHLILSETGRIIGNVKAATFNCHGILDGDIQANNVIARKSCSIHGKLEATSLTVEGQQLTVKLSGLGPSPADREKPGTVTFSSREYPAAQYRWLYSA
jgi:cytoskeletal protein CcmA (bactofilin family)